MRRLTLLSIALMLLLASCVWTYQSNPTIGRRFAVVEPDKVVFYKEPSIKSESFQVAKTEKFRTEAFACSDNRFTCVFDFFKSDYREAAFFKIRLESGKEGYLSMSYFYYLPHKNYIIDRGSVRYLSRFFFRTDYGRVWNATLDTLDELGYVILQMNKDDGYITTGMKEETRSRDKVGIRFFRDGGAVMLKVNVYSEELTSGSDSSYWSESSSNGWLEKKIRDKMVSKLGVAPWHPIK